MMTIRLLITVLLNLLVFIKSVNAEQYESDIMLRSSTTKKRRNLRDRGVSLPLFSETLQGSGRNLQSYQPCGKVLDEIPLSEMRQVLHIFGSGVLDLFALGLKYGIQVRKICSSCNSLISSSDQSVKYNATALNSICGEDIYGHNDNYSGLALFPMVNDGSELIVRPGTLKGHVHSRTTRLDSSLAPSTTWPPSPDVLGSIFATAASGAVSIIPDFIGFGESAFLHRAYLIKKGYLSSTIPLWVEVRSILVEETKGVSSLANAATFAGYSEGGYASVALADGFKTVLGTDIIGVMAGGGPYRTSSVLWIDSIKNSQKIQSKYSFIGTLLGGSYSSTYPEVANHDTGQNILSSSFYSDGKPQNPVDWLSEPDINAAEVNRRLSKVPKTSVIDNAFLNFIYESIASNDAYPCTNNYQVGFNDKFCDAFIENDLTSILESADYNVTLIHSPFDDLVSIMHLPDCDSNPNHLECKFVIGDHELAYPLYLGYLATYFTTVSDDDDGDYATGDDNDDDDDDVSILTLRF